MTDLRRSFAKMQMARFPPEAPLIFDEGEEDAENGEDMHARSASNSSASSTGLSPLPWTEFFDSELFFQRQIQGVRVTHHAYLTPPLPSGPIFVTHHGAGSSGLSFACFASEARKILPTAGILSLDARGHGKTTIDKAEADDDDESETVDLSLETLSSDLAYVIQATKSKMSWSELPDVVCVGHSLGGAVVVDLASRNLLGSPILGYAVLDVVEGSAMESLAHMETYLSRRPSKFPSLASAIEWFLRSKTIRNPVSARISVPSLLTPIENAASSTQTQSHNQSPPPSSTHQPSPQSPSPPSSTNTTTTTTNITKGNRSSYTWLTPLSPTKPYWPHWFQHLSSKFLNTRGCAKLILLAGTDRLDRELMIGQMQGRYQLEVLPEAGHFVHEDVPDKVAAVLVEFWRRNERGSLVLPPKVGAGPRGARV